MADRRGGPGAAVIDHIVHSIVLQLSGVGRAASPLDSREAACLPRLLAPPSIFKVGSTAPASLTSVSSASFSHPDPPAPPTPVQGHVRLHLGLTQVIPVTPPSASFAHVSKVPFTMLR